MTRDESKSMKKSYKRPSEILLDIVQKKNKDSHPTYQDIVDVLGPQAFGVALLFFSLPTLLPFSVIPGVSIVFSIPIIFFSLQMIGKRKSLWLPSLIAQNTISHKKISIMIKIVVPYLRMLEHISHTRWAWMTSPIMEIINGFALLFLAIMLMLPIPFSNFIFGGIILLFSLGIAEKDGVFVSIGYIFLSLYISFIYLLTLTALKFY